MSPFDVRTTSRSDVEDTTVPVTVVWVWARTGPARASASTANRASFLIANLHGHKSSFPAVTGPIEARARASGHAYGVQGRGQRGASPTSCRRSTWEDQMIAT